MGSILFFLLLSFKYNISATAHQCLSIKILVVCLRRITVEVAIKPNQGVAMRTKQENNFDIVGNAGEVQATS